MGDYSTLQSDKKKIRPPAWAVKAANQIKVPDALKGYASENTAQLVVEAETERRNIMRAMGRRKSPKSVLARWNVPETSATANDRLQKTDLDSLITSKERRRINIEDSTGAVKIGNRNIHDREQKSTPDIDRKSLDVRDTMRKWKGNQMVSRNPVYKRPNRIEAQINDEIRLAVEKEAEYRREKGFSHISGSKHQDCGTDTFHHEQQKKREKIQEIEDKIREIECETLKNQSLSLPDYSASNYSASNYSASNYDASNYAASNYAASITSSIETHNVKESADREFEIETVTPDLIALIAQDNEEKLREASILTNTLNRLRLESEEFIETSSERSCHHSTVSEDFNDQSAMKDEKLFAEEFIATEPRKIQGILKNATEKRVSSIYYDDISPKNIESLGEYSTDNATKYEIEEMIEARIVTEHETSLEEIYIEKVDVAIETFNEENFDEHLKENDDEITEAFPGGYAEEKFDEKISKTKSEGVFETNGGDCIEKYVEVFEEHTDGMLTNENRTDMQGFVYNQRPETCGEGYPTDLMQGDLTHMAINSLITDQNKKDAANSMSPTNELLITQFENLSDAIQSQKTEYMNASISSIAPSEDSGIDPLDEHLRSPMNNSKSDELQPNVSTKRTASWLNTISPRGWKSSSSEPRYAIVNPLSPRLTVEGDSDHKNNADDSGTIFQQLDSAFTMKESASHEETESLPDTNCPQKRSTPRFRIRSSRRSTQNVIDFEIESFMEREAELRKFREALNPDSCQS